MAGSQVLKPANETAIFLHEILQTQLRFSVRKIIPFIYIKTI